MKLPTIQFHQRQRRLLIDHKSSIQPATEDLKVTTLVVAVHGIGSQFRYSTVQAVTARFAAYCGRPITQPLGVFHPAKVITRPDSPELGAYLFEVPPNFAEDFNGLAFAEVFWADIPERAAATQNTTEESKAWARTVVERLQALDQSGDDNGKNLIDYNKAGAVIEEMIDAIKVLENLLFLANKAGLFNFKLGQLLTDFIGDVQIVAEFKDYGGDVFKRFADTMRNLSRRMPNLEAIHIIAHSEGTVVSLKALLAALVARQSHDNMWVNKVRGFMTIGSPLNKHIVLWPKLWQGLKPEGSRTQGKPILWRNYYDYGDPVGFDLDITREWLVTNGWTAKNGNSERDQCYPFQFRDIDDHGFTRYPFPGKAHNDYWQDADVFGHFIREVVIGKGSPSEAPPKTKWWTVIASRIVPYLICLALLAGGTYLLYRALLTVVGIKHHYTNMIRNVFGITSLLTGITLLGRMPRLDKIWPGGAIGLLGFVAGAIGYLTLTRSGTREKLELAFWPPHHSIILAGFVLVVVGFLIGLIAAGLSKLRPQWGMKPLIGLGGVAAVMVLWKLLHPSPRLASEGSLWPLALANAAFLYLWWLSALIFDLVYVWHRYISSHRKTITNTLSALRDDAPPNLRA